MKIQSALLLFCFVVACGSSDSDGVSGDSWTFSDPAIDRPDPVEPDPNPDPVQPFDPTAQACEQADEIGDDTSVVLGEELEPKETICGGIYPVTYFTMEIPPRHRLATSGVRHVAPSCDQCALDGETFINESLRNSRDVVLEATGNDSGIVYVKLHELMDHADCIVAAELAVDGQTLRGSGLMGGHRFNGCNLVDPGDSTLYYSVDVRLGGPPIEVIAKADDGQNLTISLQVINPYNGSCEMENLASCVTVDDAYFRSTDTARVVLNGEHGGGRDPARAIVAVTTHASLENSNYTIQARSFDR